MSLDKYRLSELERKLANSILVGSVDSVSATGCRVKIGDLLTAELTVLSFRKLEAGDVVMVVAHNGDLAQGFVVGSISPAGLRNFRLAFADGTAIEYDQATKQLLATSAGSIQASAATTVDVIALVAASVQAPAIALTGNVAITGTLSVGGLATLATATVGGTALAPGGDSF